MIKYRQIFNIKVLLLLLAGITVIPNFAQGLKYDEEVELGNGLIKVKSNGRYGLLDVDRKLKLPVDFQDMEFREGQAIIVYYGSSRLYGTVDSLGIIKRFKQDYYINPNYPYFSCGMICVSNKEDNGKWGYMDSNEKTITVNLKGTKGNFFSSSKVRGKFVFDYALPFSEGFACVYTEKTGWHHIDIYGKERFLLSEPSLLRTSVYHGECIIYTAESIKIYEENSDGKAGIKMYVDDNTSDLYYNHQFPEVAISNNGSTTLFLDNMLRAKKIKRINEKGTDSLVFIAPPIIEPKIVEPVDSFILKRDIQLNVDKTTIYANAKGKAIIKIIVKNKGKFDSENLEISLQCNNSNKIWIGSIASGQIEEISLIISARFAVPEITRSLEWIISTANQKIENEQKIKIMRYRPAR